MPAGRLHPSGTMGHAPPGARQLPTEASGNGATRPPTRLHIEGQCCRIARCRADPCFARRGSSPWPSLRPAPFRRPLRPRPAPPPPRRRRARSSPWTALGATTAATWPAPRRPASTTRPGTRVRLPHTWNAVGRAGRRQRLLARARLVPTALRRPDAAGQRKTFLEFDGANTVATVWLNGQRLGEHRGGFARFRLEATRHCPSGEQRAGGARRQRLRSRHPAHRRRLHLLRRPVPPGAADPHGPAPRANAGSWRPGRLPHPHPTRSGGGRRAGRRCCCGTASPRRARPRSASLSWTPAAQTVATASGETELAPGAGADLTVPRRSRFPICGGGRPIPTATPCGSRSGTAPRSATRSRCRWDCAPWRWTRSGGSSSTASRTGYGASTATRTGPTAAGPSARPSTRRTSPSWPRWAPTPSAWPTIPTISTPTSWPTAWGWWCGPRSPSSTAWWTRTPLATTPGCSSASSSARATTTRPSPSGASATR